MNPGALVFADPSAVSVLLVDLLIQKNISVTVISKQIENWRFSLQSFSTSAYSLLPSAPKSASSFQYLFIICLDNHSSAITQALPIIEKSNSKSVVALSLVKNAQAPAALLEKLSSLSQDTARTLKIIYLGEPLGKLSDLGSGPIHHLLSQANSTTRIKLPSALTSLYSISLSFAAETLLKEMFSYGLSQTVFCATKITLGDFVDRLKLFKPNLKISYHSKPKDYYISENASSFISEPFSNQTLADTLQALPAPISPPKPIPLPSKSPRRLSLKRFAFPKPRLKLNLFPLALTIFWLIAFPFLLLFVSGLSLAASYHLAKAGHFSSARSCLKTTQATSLVGKQTLSLFTRLPFVGHSLSFPSQTFLLLEKGSRVGLRVLNLVAYSDQLVNHVLKGEEYDPWLLSDQIQFELDLLYKESSFFESDFKSSGGFLTSLLPQSADISRLRRLLLSALQFSQDLPALLGADQPVTYLVLLQNNLELRPTGGFIGSFALLSFENGKLINTSLYDVYTADGQLKGYVRPPAPLVNYLGEENWYLRDSNWDPNFINSAHRAEWFLDKSLNRQVNGVIALDLDVIANLLSITGPVNLVDFNDTISHDNLNQKIQYEIESSFFPGSRKKADYLTALFNAVIYRLQELTPSQRLALAQSLYSSLESRNLQISLHQDQPSRALSVLGWDGSLSPPSCQNNCLPVWAGLVEANLGVNKANYFISREAELLINATATQTIYTLNLLLSNNASLSSNEPETRYKVYLRTLALPDAEFKNVTLFHNQTKTVLTPDISVYPDHLQAGVLVDVPPQTKSLISFNWSQPSHLDFSASGQLVFQWRKQAGVSSHPVSIKFTFPQNLSLQASPSFNLTEAGVVGYNAFLEKDINATISW